MPDTHGSHELIELVAALILSIGGGAILVRAWLDRRDRETPAALAVPAVSPPDRGATIGALRRATVAIAVGLSASASLIHFVAGPEHVEELGDLGLGFYATGLFQSVFAVAWWSGSRSRRLASVGIAVNVALVLAWFWSRTVGLPAGSTGPESAGVADVTVVLLQLALIGLLVGRLLGFDPALSSGWSTTRTRTATTSGLVAILGVIALSATIAVADATAGHGHDGTPHAEVGAGAAPHVAPEAGEPAH